MASESTLIRREVGLIVDTSGKSETRVPKFLRGLPTDAFEILGSFFADFFFGGIAFLHIYTNEKKIGLIADYLRFRRPPIAPPTSPPPTRPEPCEPVIPANPSSCGKNSSGRKPPFFLGAFFFGGIFRPVEFSFLFLLSLVHTIFFQGGLYLWITA
jgi:hypothetical protein